MKSMSALAEQVGVLVFFGFDTEIVGERNSFVESGIWGFHITTLYFESSNLKGSV